MDSASSPQRKGNGGVVLVIVLVGAWLIYAFSNTPSGKQAFSQVAAAVQPPVQVRLTPFMVFQGFYVHISNTSGVETLYGVNVTYTGASGNSVTQAVGTLKPNETKTLDPSQAKWTVEKHERISVSVTGNFVPKVVETNQLINN